MTKQVTRFLRAEEGQDLIEYALLAAFVSLVSASGMSLLGVSVGDWYANHAARVQGFRTAP